MTGVHTHFNNRVEVNQEEIPERRVGKDSEASEHMESEGPAAPVPAQCRPQPIWLRCPMFRVPEECQKSGLLCKISCFFFNVGN